MSNPEGRHVDDPPSSDHLPALPRGNAWKFDFQIREWEVVITPEHPQWNDHPLPELPEPRHALAKSSIYHPLPFKVKAAKTVRLVSEDGTIKVTVELDEEAHAEFGAVEWWNVVLLPRQGGAEVDRG